MIWNLIGSIGGKVLDIVDDVVEDEDEANRLKFQIQKQLISCVLKLSPVKFHSQGAPHKGETTYVERSDAAEQK